MQYQKHLGFNASATPQQEPEQVACDTSLPPPLVRPDRQIVYDGANPSAWPDASGLCDNDTITVDRVQPGMDGPAHRFLIKRGDTVEAWFGKDNFKPGTVVGISHARKEVRVRFTEATEGQWFAVGAIYPAPQHEAPETSSPLGKAIVQVNDPRASPDGFTSAGPVPLPASPDEVLAYLKESPGKEFTSRELRQHFGHTDFDPARPLENAVHLALATLRDRGLIHVEEPRFGEPRFSVLKLPGTASELTRGDCPPTLAGPEVRRLLREHGWTIGAFAERWGFTQKHVREVLDRGLSDQNAVRDWIEAALASPSAATAKARFHGRRKR